jgi:hypothetical protein
VWARRALAIGALFGLASLPSGPAPEALPSIPPSPAPLICPEPVLVDLQLVGAPIPVGYPVVGYTLEIDARHVKFHGSYPPGCGLSDFTYPLLQFQWSLVAPPGSAATLTGTSGLQPRLVLDTTGTRTIRLTACPSGCTISDPSGHPVSVAAQTVELAVNVVASAPLGPETMPVLPELVEAPFHALTQDNCSFGAGLIASQWFAVEQIDGPQDYRLMEGLVRHSRVSRKDSFLNHGSQDFNFYVQPDPPFRNLLFEPSDPGHPPTELEIEWERDSLPERYRPTRGDRVSVFGHWIYDCSHENHAEIHPPVGVAVHRPRPIRIPESKTFPEFGGQGAGSNVYVPGIITDVFFSTDGGDLVDCSTDTGLKNADFTTLPNGTQAPTCIPPPSLDRIFEFDIYLPRDPRLVLQDAGVSGLAPVPVYRDFETPPGAVPGPNPVLELRPNATSPTHVHVTIDLRGFTGSRYEKRIVSGWVLPAANNWGLGRWKLRLNKLEIFNDGDGSARGDGDWRLWINTNNAASVGFPPQEWTQILNQDVHGVENFGGRPWQTDAPTSDRSLGPDLLRYPPPNQTVPGPRDYGILFHSTGYEADTFTDDDAGTIAVRSAAEPQPAFGFSNICHPSSDVGGLVYSGCVSYSAFFEVLAGPPVPNAVLTPGARAVADTYVLTECAQAGGPLCGLNPPVVGAAVEPPILHPLDAHLGFRATAAPFTESRPFRPGSRENALTEMSVEQVHAIVAAVRPKDPARVEKLLRDLRAGLDEKLATPSLVRDVQADLPVLEAALPRDLWTRYFGDIARPAPPSRSPAAKLAGQGTFGPGRAEVQLKRMRLHCAQDQRPNRMRLVSGANRFDLDFVLQASCTDDPAVANSPSAAFDTHRGKGIGRLNGIPGAVVEWSLVDGGPSGTDEAFVTVRSGAEGAVALSGSGRLRRGDLRATERTFR